MKYADVWGSVIYAYTSKFSVGLFNSFFLDGHVVNIQSMI